MDFEEIVKCIAEAACEADQNGNITYISPQFYDILGYKSEELIGKNLFEFINSNDLNAAKSCLQEAMNSRSLFSLNIKLKHKNGQYLPISSRGRVVEQNGIIQLILIMHDESDRLKIEQELQSRAKKLEILNEIIRIGSQSRELNSYFERILRRILKTLNFDGSGIYLLNTADKKASVVMYKNLPKDFIEEVKVVDIEKQPYNKIFLLGEPIFTEDYNKLNRQRAEKYGFNSLASVPIFSQNEIIGALNVVSKKKIIFTPLEKEALHSIASEIGMAITKIKAQERLQESYQRAEFYKDLVVHDILNIVQNIKTSIDLNDLYSKNKSPKYPPQYFFNIIQTEVERAINLVVNVRKIAVLDQSKIEIVPTNVNEIVKRIANSIINRFGNKRVTINIDSKLDPLIVLANEFISDVIENILINAVKHNSSEKAEISVKMLKEQINTENYARIEFWDNGNGVPDNVKEKIFERVFKEHKETGGMGIGLSLVKKIVESYKGKVWVEDRVKGDYQQGSVFVVLVPLALVEK